MKTSWLLMFQHFKRKKKWIFKKWKTIAMSSMRYDYRSGFEVLGYLIKLLYTSVEESRKKITGECDFQMDWYSEQFFLKYTCPLYYTLVQSTTEGVQISYASVNRLIHLKFTFPPYSLVNIPLEMWRFHRVTPVRNPVSLKPFPPPHKITLCTRVYEKLPFWVLASPPKPPSHHFEKPSYSTSRILTFYWKLTE